MQVSHSEQVHIGDTIMSTHSKTPQHVLWTHNGNHGVCYLLQRLADLLQTCSNQAWLPVKLESRRAQAVS